MLPFKTSYIFLFLLVLGSKLRAAETAGTSNGDEDTPWVKAIDIRSMSPATAEEAHLVRLRGTVIFNEGSSAVFLQDETAGTLFWTKKGEIQPTPGDIVEVQGVTRFGLYVPGINNPTFRVIQRGPMPEPIDATYEDLISGRYHYQWVEVEGVIRSINTTDPERIMLQLGMGSQVIAVRLTDPPSREDLIDSRVRVTGLASGTVNNRKQLLQPYIWPHDESGIEIIEPAPALESIPDSHATDLLTFRPTGRATGHRVRMSGIILASFDDGRVYLRDDTGAFSVQLSTRQTLHPGDVVMAFGFPELQRFSASLADAVVEKGSSGPAPSPSQPSMADFLQGDFDNDLVTLTAEVSETFRTESGTVMLLHGGKRPIRVNAPSMEIMPEVGSLLRITGICQVETITTPSSYQSVPQSFSIHARSLADLVILKSPSWWTIRRLTIALFGLAVAMLIAGLWIVLLQRQVEKQTNALTSSIEHKAMLEERQRIAREFHDTLEQELAGLSLHLGAATARPSLNDEKGRGLLNTATHLVSRIQSETRNLLADLRTPADQMPDLPSALKALADKHPGDVGPRVELDPDHPQLQLPPRIIHHLRMMAQEAVTNAIKHAQAKLITLKLELDAGNILLAIQDDGVGFDAAAETWEKPGHYGCMGIRERARKLGATVAWQSTPGQGTQVKIALPLNSELESL